MNEGILQVANAFTLQRAWLLSGGGKSENCCCNFLTASVGISPIISGLIQVCVAGLLSTVHFHFIANVRKKFFLIAKSSLQNFLMGVKYV